MNPTGIVGHDEVLKRFAGWLEAERMAGSWLLVGPDGIGKLQTARYLAACLLCEQSDPRQLQRCGQCPSCLQIAAGTHPDLLEVSRPADKNRIPVELLIGSTEKRMREGLCHDLALRPFGGRVRVAIIDDADFLNAEGANCLLKTLEEPPRHAVIFLIGSNEHKQLPTILSRCRIVRFQPLETCQVLSILQRLQPAADGVSLEQMAAISGGSVEFALQTGTPEWLEFRGDLLMALASLDPMDQGFAESVSGFVEAAGKDPALRRDRLRLIVEIGTRFLRQLLLSLGGARPQGDAALCEAVNVARGRWNAGLEAAADCIERTSEVRNDIAANANQALLVECWLTDLGRIMRGEPVTTGDLG